MINPFGYYVRYKKRTHRKDNRCVKNPLWLHLLLPAIGLLALVWFLIRVVPKPSRATYPCQRIAFPFASGFIIWVVGILASLSFLKKAKHALTQKKYCAFGSCFMVVVLCLWTAFNLTSHRTALADEPTRNQPVGVAKGIFPGRVVWVHDPNATDWDENGDGYSWQPEHTSQKHVDAMVAKAVRQLTGCITDSCAWDALFRHFNVEHGKGDVGYTPGETITIKVNLTTTGMGANMDTETYDKDGYLDKSDTSPRMILGLIRQLVLKAGVDPNAIAVGDTLCHYPNQWRDPIYNEFPEVIFFDARGEMGRTLSVPSQIRQYWSDPNLPVVDANDFIPVLYAEADYLINLPVLKGHLAGITLCAKNHYGSYNRRPDAVGDGYFDLHNSLASELFDPLPKQYRALVDIMGHPHMGGKTLLYMIDGLYGGYYWRGTPRRFEQPLFNNDWPSSILASQDPVAIDSVGLDILWEEWALEAGGYVVRAPGVDDYLKEAAMANDPPSETFYDPDNDGVALESLGVYERWNNSTDRQYSRNLGNGNGIELVYIKMTNRFADISANGTVDTPDLIQLADQWLWIGQPGQILEDLTEDGTVNYADFSILATYWGSGAD